MRNSYYRWISTSLGHQMKIVKKNSIFCKLFWQKVFVHWELKLLNFLVNSVLKLIHGTKIDDIKWHQLILLPLWLLPTKWKTSKAEFVCFETCGYHAEFVFGGANKTLQSI